MPFKLFFSLSLFKRPFLSSKMPQMVRRGSMDRSKPTILNYVFYTIQNNFKTINSHSTIITISVRPNYFFLPQCLRVCSNLLGLRLTYRAFKTPLTTTCSLSFYALPKTDPSLTLFSLQQISARV